MYKVGMWKVKALAIFVILFFTALTVFFIFGAIYLIQKDLKKDATMTFMMIPINLAVIYGGFWLTWYCHSITINEDCIIVKAYRSEYRFDYKNAVYFEYCGDNLIIGDDVYRLPFPADSYWSGKDRKKAYEFLVKKLEEYEIPLTHGWRAFYPWFYGYNGKKIEY